jgi:hypothetical protein
VRRLWHSVAGKSEIDCKATVPLLRREKMKILQIGCGGIGSWLIDHVNRAYEEGQIEDDVEYDIADPDTVETKNIKLGQNFGPKDIGKNKATALKKRYPCVNNAIARKAESLDVTGYDLFILAVDNTQTRRYFFVGCDATGKPFIDLRAEGRSAFGMPNIGPDASCSPTLKKEGYNTVRALPRQSEFRCWSIICVERQTKWWW